MPLIPLAPYVVGALAVFCAGSLAAQDYSISVYSGYQSAPHSNVTGSDPAGAGDFDFTAGWDSKPFAMPPYYGVRGTWWLSERFGLTADFNHTKVYADQETFDKSGFEVLEFTDGLNNLTFGGVWRWPAAWGDKLTPYAGLSAGLIIPHVEVQTTPTAPKTFEYQVAGPSVAWIAGASFEMNERWDVFGEYKGTYSQLNADLEGGGSLRTDIVTNAINLGVAFKF
ncbi:outer membrane beta-barrel protein [Celeribacter arenosi]|uniref:Outer membrane beta-barrel protein n=1 Tax=Celeribacter arenosi TaxID=792649 RepID=A0ABP7K1Q1_9RHOB